MELATEPDAILPPLAPVPLSLHTRDAFRRHICHVVGGHQERRVGSGRQRLLPPLAPLETLNVAAAGSLSETLR